MQEQNIPFREGRAEAGLQNMIGKKIKATFCENLRVILIIKERIPCRSFGKEFN